MSKPRQLRTPHWRAGRRQPPDTVAVRLATVAVLMLVAVALSGCGKTMQHAATEQLVLSDAVDRSVSSIDFTPLSGTQCYLDSSHLEQVELKSLVSIPYVVSSLRNQLIAAGCFLAEERDEADVILEPRLGTLGADAHDVTYGIPSSNLLSQAAALMPTAPPIPSIPEIALARKDDQTGAAKIAVFAYEAKSGRPLWQSGTSIARSTARNLWVLGVGPIQRGSVYEGTRFAGSQMSLPLARKKQELRESRQVISLDEPFLFEEVPRPSKEETAMVEPRTKRD